MPTLSTQLTRGAALAPGMDDIGGKEAIEPELLLLARFECLGCQALACLGACTGAHLIVADGGSVCVDPKGVPEFGVVGDGVDEGEEGSYGLLRFVDESDR